MCLPWLLLVPQVNECSSRGYPVLVPEVQGVFLEIILAILLNKIRDPHPHNTNDEEQVETNDKMGEKKMNT